jgi:DNA mismatch repair protein MSH2
VVCLINASQLKDALAEIIKSKKVEFYSQDSRKNWKVSTSASPGNLDPIEHLLPIESNSSCIVASIYVASEMVGVAFADVNEYTIGLSEFADNDIYANLEIMMVQLNVKECLYPLNVDPRIREIVNALGIVGTELKLNEFESASTSSDVEHLTDGSGYSQYGSSCIFITLVKYRSDCTQIC